MGLAMIASDGSHVFVDQTIYQEAWREMEGWLRGLSEATPATPLGIDVVLEVRHAARLNAGRRD